jgi:hypothetical protein
MRDELNAGHQSCVLQQSAWRLVVIPLMAAMRPCWGLSLPLCSVYFAGIRSKARSYRTYLLVCV